MNPSYLSWGILTTHAGDGRMICMGIAMPEKNIVIWPSYGYLMNLMDLRCWKPHWLRCSKVSRLQTFTMDSLLNNPSCAKNFSSLGLPRQTGHQEHSIGRRHCRHNSAWSAHVLCSIQVFQVQAGVTAWPFAIITSRLRSNGMLGIYIYIYIQQSIYFNRSMLVIKKNVYTCMVRVL